MTPKPMMQCGHVANATRGDSFPVCAICIGIDPRGALVVAQLPDLTGRIARCGCGATSPSSRKLPFFLFRGEGSYHALDNCKHCRYGQMAHDPAEMAKNVPHNRRTVVEDGLCPGFEAHGAYETDIYYCGCRGWD